MIEAHSLSRRFGNFTAVSQISLTVPDGAVLALLGPNGAGKTTTVRMLAGLLAPTEGHATVAGYDVRRDPSAVRAHVGLVTDVPGLFEQMTLAAYLDFFGQVYGMLSEIRSRRIQELLEFFDLLAQRNDKMAGFSKGMKQKVALARALIHEPTVLFLDEPTSGLDPLSSRSVRELILSLKNSRRSIILCTHDLDEAERLADEVAIIRQGRIIASGSPAALRTRATSDALVRIELAEPAPQARQILLSFGNLISEADPTHSSTQSNDLILTYRASDPRTTNPQIIARLSAANVQIVSVTCETTSLEDVYASAMSDPVDQIAPADQQPRIALSSGKEQKING